MKLVAATGNKHKLEEFRRILEPLDIELLSLADAGIDCDVEETGSTFGENARIKARYVFEKTGLPAVADDSGLCVDALGGRPGVHSARYLGEDTPHSQKIQGLLGEMLGVPPKRRTCRFTAAICCVLDSGREITCEQSCEGHLAFEPAGDNGFGYDPIFLVGDRTIAEISDEEKDAISHRGKALRAFMGLLREELQPR